MAGDKTLSEKIYHELYDDITHHRLKMGQNLTLSMLKERFGTSHTPIREAMNRLVADGIVEYSSNKGMKVKTFTEQQIKDIYRFTAELECMAIRMCGDNFVMEAMIERVNEIVADEETFAEDGDTEKWEKKANEIHSVFFRLADNEYLLEAANRMEAKMDLVALMYSTHDSRTRIYERHKQIAAALENHDIEEVERLTRAYMQTNMVHVLNSMRADNSNE